MKNNIAKTKYFTAKVKSANQIVLEFGKKQSANTFGRMDFYSRVLHSLSPDAERIWRPKQRLDAEIKGWPKNIRWQRAGKLLFEGQIENGTAIDIQTYSETLEMALESILKGTVTKNMARLHIFYIGKDGHWTKYQFHSKARTIAALCVLYDLKAHPRNDLELNIQKKFGPQNEWPLDKDLNSYQRTYGDPSKTADELRNEGWPRSGNAASMEVFRQVVAGARQQMYKIKKRKQTLSARVPRTNISKRWRDELFKSQNYTCQICLNKYDPALLEPDHRIPVIYEADVLTDDNFKEKLMTLCRYCNQQKRETTKRFPPDYDWQSSPWAYPEKFDALKVKQGIERIAKRGNITFEEALNLIRK